MSACRKCGRFIPEGATRNVYAKRNFVAHRICPKRKGKKKRVFVHVRRAAATVLREFLDERSYVCPDGREVLYGKDWKARVEEVFERDLWLCHWPVVSPWTNLKRFCGSSAVHAHHIIKRSVKRDDRMENLIAICAKHHREAHPEKQLRNSKVGAGR